MTTFPSCIFGGRRLPRINSLSICKYMVLVVRPYNVTESTMNTHHSARNARTSTFAPPSGVTAHTHTQSAILRQVRAGLFGVMFDLQLHAMMRLRHDPNNAQSKLHISCANNYQMHPSCAKYESPGRGCSQYDGPVVRRLSLVGRDCNSLERVLRCPDPHVESVLCAVLCCRFWLHRGSGSGPVTSGCGRCGRRPRSLR